MHDQPIQRDQQRRPGLLARTTAAASRAMRPARTTAAAGLLAAVTVAWAAVPMSSAAAGARPALIVAICCAFLGAAQLAARHHHHHQNSQHVFDPPVVRYWRQLMAIVRAAPWAEGTIVATLALEALHHSRPWHAGLLGAALLAFLLATHLAETDAGAGCLRPQLPLLAAGLGLLVLAVGAAALPVGTSPASAWLRVLAVIAALIAGGLAVPV
jgi:hypothetical protein